MRLFGKLLFASLFATAIVAGCKTSTAGGNAGAGSADGGMTSAMESAAQGMADAGVAAASGAASTAADAARKIGGTAMDAGAAAASAAMDAGMGAMGAGMGAMSAGMGAMGSADAGTPASSSGDAGSAAAAPVNDGQIAAIAGAANQGDILKSRLAKKRSKNAKVKEFASLMIKDHSALDAQAKKLGIAPEESEMSRALTQGAQDALTKLTPLAGKEFDTAYVDIQVGSHEKVLKALDETLIPSAQDPKLKALLQTARAKVQMHLEHAQKLQSMLAK